MTLPEMLNDIETHEERVKLTEKLNTVFLDELRELYKQRSRIDEEISWYKSKIDEIELYRKRWGL